MTLREAIEHAKEKAEELGSCECARDHLQLAKWLEELLSLEDEKKSDEFFKKNYRYPLLKMILTCPKCNRGNPVRVGLAETEESNTLYYIPLIEVNCDCGNKIKMRWDEYGGVLLSYEEGLKNENEL